MIAVLNSGNTQLSPFIAQNRDAIAQLTDAVDSQLKVAMDDVQTQLAAAGSPTKVGDILLRATWFSCPVVRLG